MYSRNCSFYRNGNSANFFPRVCNGKKLKGLFTPTWNGIAASVRRVSSAPVVINARLPDWLQHRETKEDGKKQRNTKTVMLFRGRTQTLNFYRGLEYARSKKFVIFFNNQCNPIEICFYDRKKYSFTSYPAAKHPKK